MRGVLRLLIQNLDGIILRENFLIASIVTIFVIRIFLKLTNYPQLSGGENLHIAHLLWGGFFMALALLLLFSFVGRRITGLASILGGIGFGAFIDELGKFITQDNNYFFQPTVALLYIIFILIYSTSKLLENSAVISSKEYLVNSLRMVTEAVINDLDEEEKKKALLYLGKSDPRDPLVKALKTFFTEIQSVPVPPPSILNKVRHYIFTFYLRLTRSMIISKLLVAILLIQSLSSVVFLGFDFQTSQSLSFIQTGELISSILSTAIVLIGIVFLRKSKERGFRLFKIAIFISLLLTQFFTFYTEQFRALFWLASNLILLTIVDYSLDKDM